MYSIGRMFGTAFAMQQAATPAWHPDDEQEKAVAPLQRSTIEVTRDQTEKLISRMGDRRTHWETVIKDATEELRQVNVILDGAKQMLTRIEMSYPTPQPASDADFGVSENDIIEMLRDPLMPAK